MTNREAAVGIGRLVRHTYSGRRGRLIEVQGPTRKNYYVGVVNFDGKTERVWLKKLEWVDGPPPTPRSMSVPHREVLNALARFATDGKPVPLFQLLFGRPPSRDEIRYIRGKLGGDCPRCGGLRLVTFEPNGLAIIDCHCVPLDDTAPPDETPTP